MADVETWLGLVGRTAQWPLRLEAWSASGELPIRMSYCPTVSHLSARLHDGAASVVLLDGDLSLVDRDLLGAIATVGGTAVVVEGTRRRVAWDRLGAAAVVPADFDRAQLFAATTPSSPVPAATGAVGRSTAPLIAVTGPGGTGASVLAIALAQGLSVSRRRVLLADCCLHAEQAMLHNTHGSLPNVTDLVDLHAGRTPDERQVRQLAMGIVERGYYLLPGIARAREWSRIRSASLRVTLGSLRAAFGVVVADVDAEVEGEAEGGSTEVEERNTLARAILGDADVSVVVGQPTMKGVYALVRTTIELLEFGVAPQRLLPVLNQVPPSERTRADLSRAVRHLTEGVVGGSALGPVLFVPTVPVEEQLREGDALPDTVSSLLAGAVSSMLDRGGRREAPAPARVSAGSIGHWSDAP